MTVIFTANAEEGTGVWTATAGDVTVDTSVKRSPGTYGSLKLNTGNPAVQPILRKSGVLDDAGRRTSCWRYFPETTPTGGGGIVACTDAAGTAAISINLGTAAKLSIVSGGGSTVGLTVLSDSTWYRISLSYTITNSTTYEARLYLDGNLEATRTAGTLVTTVTERFQLNLGTTLGTDFVSHADLVYIDDGTDLADPIINRAFLLRG